MITSLDNKKVKEWTKLHNKKYRNDNYLLFDEKQIKAAYENNKLQTLIYYNECPFKLSDSYEVSKEVFNKISKGINCSYIGIGKRIEEKRNYNNRVLLLEDLQDPLNVGRIINNAYLFNFDSVVISNNTSDLYNPKCLNEAKEAIYKINIIHSDIREEIISLKEKGFKVFTTGLKDYSLEMYDVETCDKMAFVLGNEGSGVKENTMKISDEIIKIDMHNIDSLNVAMAAAILMYRFKI